MKVSSKVFIVSCFALFFLVTSMNAQNVQLTGFSQEEVHVPQRFIIYYDGDIDLLVKEKDSYLKSFLEAYNLELVNTFEIDDYNKGFSVITKKKLSISNYQLARELSMLHHVTMVEVVNEPLNETEV